MVQWVKHGSQYERPFTESTDEWANHYDIIPDITRVRKPKDKAPVESLVDQVYKYVYARKSPGRRRCSGDWSQAGVIGERDGRASGAGGRTPE